MKKLEKEKIKMRKKLRMLPKIAITAMAVSSLCISSFAAAAEEGTSNEVQTAAQATQEEAAGLLVGAAVRDITPTENMYPLTRKPNVEMTGVLDPLHVRVIAISDNDTTTLLVCTETGRSLGPQYAQLIADHTGMSLDSIILTSTHSHAAPEVTEYVELDFEEDDPEVTNLQKWAKYTRDMVFEAVDEALANQKPATVGIGYSDSYINVNRSAAYNQINEETGEMEEYRYLGYNGEGPSDKTVAAIRFNDQEGNPIAIVVNYAVHGTVMHANTCLDGKTGISADIPGMVSGYLEENYEGAVAMWLSGAAGDQNPIVQNDVYTRNPETGEFEETFTDDYTLLTYLSKIHYTDVEEALNSIEDYSADVEVEYEFIDSAIPASENYEEEEFPITLQMLRVGDIGLACFSGELFSATGMYMKENALLKDTIVVNHAWQRDYQANGYCADDESIALGGFGTNAKYQTGYLTEELTSMMNQFYEETGAWIDQGDGTARYSTADEVTIIGQDGIAGTSDDNKIVNPAGTVVAEDVQASYDEEGQVYVDLGNGFKLYAGDDGKIGTTDDVVKNFGQYKQSDAGDEVRGLNWLLLDIQDGKATLITEQIVDGVSFNLNDSDGDDWAESNMRSWLNSTGGQNMLGDTTGFYDAAFNEEEKEKIVLTDVSMNSDSSYIAYNTLLESDWWGDYTTHGTDTQDYVWALSGEEAFEYFGLSTIATYEELGHDPANYTNAQCTPTLYAQAEGVKINTGHNGASFIGFGDFWLRSPGAESDGTTYYGVFLGSTGSCNVGRPVTRTYGARPVVTVNLQ